ncbi:GNAT family N-acetyltransferase [Fibrivirga algicola]|uniref:GNAT family N-acetyltransferase n=1 Tax=Fibrivirga algicola TaxID=2950420 RepID=A0ABX0QD94_9BACT|nr:GNAT family N-acetyltransferase [Fibrivirga algicola]NID09957.1 GNAT family N-acetyltransferase [Fibrivirga algicola]
MTCKHYIGSEIREAFDGLAQLRIAVFREFPYLYEGSIEYEKTYLNTYAESERAMLFAVYDSDRMVGGTTCLPLLDETAEVQRPFSREGYDLSTIFYFGESLLLPAYRGRGLGHRFFDEREAHVRTFGTYLTTTFCAVQRPADHPLRPADYRPLDAFWQQRGYQLNPALQTTFSWPDLGEVTDSGKVMQFYTRALPRQDVSPLQSITSTANC